MQSLGWFNRGLIWVLLMPEQADEKRNPCLIIKNNGGKKNYNMALKTHTQTHQTKDVTAPHCTTHDSHSSGRLQILWRKYIGTTLPVWIFLWSWEVEILFSCLTPMKDYSFFLFFPLDSLSGSRPFSDTMPCLLLAQLLTKYFTISFTGETTCN